MRDAFKAYDALSQGLQRVGVLVDLLSTADPNDLADDTRGQAGVMVQAELDTVKALAAELYSLAGGRRGDRRLFSSASFRRRAHAGHAHTAAKFASDPKQTG